MSRRLDPIWTTISLVAMVISGLIIVVIMIAAVAMWIFEWETARALLVLGVIFVVSKHQFIKFASKL